MEHLPTDPDAYADGIETVAVDCPDCGRSCKASTTYDTTLYEEVRSWHCVECQQHYYREDMHGDDRLPQPEER